MSKSMAITAADLPPPHLPLVRRMEASGFRAWPAAEVSYDGSWQLRMTPGHPSRRLNCLAPLDPGDTSDMQARIDRADAMMRARGIVPSVRQTPLFPPDLIPVLKAGGWLPRQDTFVMVADLSESELADGMDHLPIHDAHRFAEACIAIDDGRETTAEVLQGIIERIAPATGLFLMEDQTGPTAVGICVQDNDLAGLQQVVVAERARRRGLGREIVCAALRWAKLRGARQAWLQVTAGNAPAISLYESLGFKPAYLYTYWQKDG
jgi:ribosomal protein S18 acetylase RimI-like enzyme